MSKKWQVYILRCADNSLYTGITTDIKRRLNEHNFSNTLGAKYTRVRRPVNLVFQEEMASRSLASRKEYQLKKLVKSSKEKIIEQYLSNHSPL